MEFYIPLPYDEVVKVDITPNMTVEELRAEISDKIQIPANLIKLIHDSQQLPLKHKVKKDARVKIKVELDIDEPSKSDSTKSHLKNLKRRNNILLTDLGFPSSIVDNALKEANDNIDDAISLILAENQVKSSIISFISDTKELQEVVQSIQQENAAKMNNSHAKPTNSKESKSKNHANENNSEHNIVLHQENSLTAIKSYLTNIIRKELNTKENKKPHNWSKKADNHLMNEYKKLATENDKWSILQSKFPLVTLSDIRERVMSLQLDIMASKSKQIEDRKNLFKNSPLIYALPKEDQIYLLKVVLSDESDSTIQDSIRKHFKDYNAADIKKFYIQTKAYIDRLKETTEEEQEMFINDSTDLDDIPEDTIMEVYAMSHDIKNKWAQMATIFRKIHPNKIRSRVLTMLKHAEDPIKKPESDDQFLIDMLTMKRRNWKKLLESFPGNSKTDLLKRFNSLREEINNGNRTDLTFPDDYTDKTTDIKQLSPKSSDISESYESSSSESDSEESSDSDDDDDSDDEDSENSSSSDSSDDESEPEAQATSEEEKPVIKRKTTRRRKSFKKTRQVRKPRKNKRLKAKDKEDKEETEPKKTEKEEKAKISDPNQPLEPENLPDITKTADTETKQRTKHHKKSDENEQQKEDEEPGLKQRWRPEEDDLLLELYQKYQFESNKMEKIHFYFPTRTLSSIINRVTRLKQSPKPPAEKKEISKDIPKEPELMNPQTPPKQPSDVLIIKHTNTPIAPIQQIIPQQQLIIQPQYMYTQQTQMTAQQPQIISQAQQINIIKVNDFAADSNYIPPLRPPIKVYNREPSELKTVSAKHLLIKYAKKDLIQNRKQLWTKQDDEKLILEYCNGRDIYKLFPKKSKCSVAARLSKLKQMSRNPVRADDIDLEVIDKLRDKIGVPKLLEPDIGPYVPISPNIYDVSELIVNDI